MAVTRSLRCSNLSNLLASSCKPFASFSRLNRTVRRATSIQTFNHMPPFYISTAARSFTTTHALEKADRMVSYSTVPAPHNGGTVANVTIQNAARLNSMDEDTLVELRDIFRSLSEDSKLRAVILTGELSTGKAPAFCGGANIYRMARINSSDEARAFITKIHEVNLAIRELPAIVIARIHGLTFGAGLEIAASCDFRLATEQSIFGMPEVKLGLPSVVEARLLANLIGWQETRRMVMLAENYSAQQAKDIGLIDGCFTTTQQLDDEVKRFVEIISSHGPEAMKSQKRLNKIWEENDLETGLKAGIEAFADTWKDGGSEPKQYMKIFTERKRTK